MTPAEKLELKRRVETCPLCGRKALENPSTDFDETAAAMREHMVIAHSRAMVLIFDVALARYRARRSRS